MECIWGGTLLSLPARVYGTTTLTSINQLITPVTSIRYRVTLASEEGNEILPCFSCLRRRITSTIMFYKLDVTTNGTNHPDIEYDLLIVCDGTIEHRAGRYYRLFIERHG